MRQSKFPNRSFIVACLGLMVSALLCGNVEAGDTRRNGRIIFTANLSGSCQLHAINPDGTGLVQITKMPSIPDEGGGWLPDVSVDGRRIVFCFGAFPSENGPQTDIYVINADGTELKQLTSDGAFNCAPRWSPDGSRIVFERTGIITTMRADGTDKKALTSPLWGGGYQCTYTPEGNHIVFETQQEGLIDALWIMRTDGSSQRRLTPAALEAGGVGISSDGKHLVFLNHVNLPLPSAVFTMDLENMHFQQLTNPGSASDSFPNYSPDGTKIVFTSNRMSADGSMDLFTMNADGSGITRIATGLTVGGCPSGGCVSPAWGVKAQ